MNGARNAWVEQHIIDCLRWSSMFHQQYVEQLYDFAIQRGDRPEGLSTSTVRDAARHLVAEGRITEQSTDFFMVTGVQLQALGGATSEPPPWYGRAGA